jgi:lipid A disaccharide synthetase
LKELIQHDYTLANLKQEFEAILPNGNKNANLMVEYKNLQAILNKQGASNNAAQIIIDLVKK